jgi:hypothetical protein
MGRSPTRGTHDARVTSRAIMYQAFATIVYHQFAAIVYQAFAAKVYRDKW